MWNGAELDASRAFQAEYQLELADYKQHFLVEHRKERVPHVTSLVLGTDPCGTQDVKGFWLRTVVQKVWQAPVRLAGL